MDTFEFVPSVCKESKDEQGNVIEPKFKGSITLKVPEFDDRMAFVEECGPALLSAQDGMKSDIDYIPAVRKLVKLSEPFYAKVQIESIASGKKYESFKDLSRSAGMNSALQEVAMQLMQGEDLGN
jgi:hypothetical protein